MTEKEFELLEKGDIVCNPFSNEPLQIVIDIDDDIVITNEKTNPSKTYKNSYQDLIYCTNHKN